MVIRLLKSFVQRVTIAKKKRIDDYEQCLTRSPTEIDHGYRFLLFRDSNYSQKYVMVKIANKYFFQQYKN